MGWEVLVFGLAGAAVALGCLLPAGCLPVLPNDKLLHFLAFAGLSALAARIAPAWPQQGFWLLGLLVAGWLIELLQKLVPGRSFCWQDLAANAGGIAAAALAALLVRAI